MLTSDIGGGVRGRIVDHDHLGDERPEGRDARADTTGLVPSRHDSDHTQGHGNGGSGSAPSLTP